MRNAAASLERAKSRPRNWRGGWDREARPPADPELQARPGRGTDSPTEWRSADPRISDEGWKAGHDERRRVVRVLRQAGYVARHRYPRRIAGTRKAGPHTLPDWRYSSGRLQGQPAVDPWQVARKVAACSSAWTASLRLARAGLTCYPAPRMCGLSHVCPVCAHRESVCLAGAIRTHLGGDYSRCVLVTLTQRTREGEPLGPALDRWRAAWRMLYTGREGARWRAMVEGWVLGVEVGPEAARRGAWHVHGHLVVRLRDGVDLEAARTWMGERWQSVTRSASGPDGWDPIAGGCTPSVHEECTTWDWSGRWWSDIEGTEKSVYQACKYATTTADLGASQMAEWLSASFGRRWHESGGAWRGILRAAKEDLATLDTAEAPEGFDIGENVGWLSPAESPALDVIAPELGREDPADDWPAGPRTDLVTWRIASAWHLSEELLRSVSAAGGAMARRWVPLGEVHDDPATGELWRVDIEWQEHATVPAMWAWAEVVRQTDAARRAATGIEPTAETEPTGSGGQGGPPDSTRTTQTLFRGG